MSAHDTPMESPGCGFLDDSEVGDLLDGHLDPARRSALEEHVSTGCGRCALLLADLEVFADVAREGINEAERREFERVSEMASARLRRAVAVEPTTRPATRRPHLGWGVGLAVAAALLAFIFLSPARRSSDTFSLSLPDGGTWTIDAMAFSTPPALRGDAGVEVWSAARDAYAAGHFDDAAEKLRLLTETDPAIVDAWLYRGVAELLSGRTDVAVPSLQQAREQAREQDLPDSAPRWYLAQALLAEHRLDEGRPILEALAAEDSRWADRARELLSRLGDE